MGSSFVSIGKNGFWMMDSTLQLWLRLLALHIEDPVESGGVTAKIRDQWLAASRHSSTGCVPDGLEDAVSTEEGKRFVIAAIESLLTALQRGPTAISKEALNLLGLAGGGFARDFETWRLVEVGNAFLDLINGRIASADRDRWPGSR